MRVARIERSYCDGLKRIERGEGREKRYGMRVTERRVSIDGGRIECSRVFCSCNSDPLEYYRRLIAHPDVVSQSELIRAISLEDSSRSNGRYFVQAHADIAAFLVSKGATSSCEQKCMKCKLLRAQVRFCSRFCKPGAFLEMLCMPCPTAAISPPRRSRARRNGPAVLSARWPGRCRRRSGGWSGRRLRGSGGWLRRRSASRPWRRRGNAPRASPCATESESESVMRKEGISNFL